MHEFLALGRVGIIGPSGLSKFFLFFFNPVRVLKGSFFYLNKFIFRFKTNVPSPNQLESLNSQ